MTENTNLIEKLFWQPSVLPEPIITAIREQLPAGEEIVIYAYCDFDSARKFKGNWLILTSSYLIRTDARDKQTTNGSCQPHALRLIPLSQVKKLNLSEGFTLNRLDIISRNDDGLLDSVYFTRRQLRNVVNLRFIAEQLLQQIDDGQSNGVLNGVADLPSVGQVADVVYQESLLQAIREAKSTVIARQQNVFARLLSYLKPHRTEVILGFLASILLTVLGLLPPCITRVLVVDILKPTETGHISEPLFWAWVVIGSLACVWTALAAMNFLRLRLMTFVGEKIAARLRDDLYQHLQKLGLSFFHQRSTGSIISRVTSDTDLLWDFITFGIIEFIISAPTLAGVAIALFLQDVALASPVVIPLPPMLYLFYWHSKRSQGLFLRIWRK